MFGCAQISSGQSTVSTKAALVWLWYLVAMLGWQEGQATIGVTAEIYQAIDPKYIKNKSFKLLLQRIMQEDNASALILQLAKIIPQPLPTFAQNSDQDLKLSRLLWAAIKEDCRDNLKILELMLECGVSPDVVDIEVVIGYVAPIKISLLHAVVQKRRLDVAALLLAYKADVDVRDEVGRTPIFAAICNGDKDMVKLLLLNGASLNIQDKALITPLKCAEIEVMLEGFFAQAPEALQTRISIVNMIQAAMAVA